ncbi:hypothetical protein MRX96_000705 [Rhipicephalus microplus]
MARSTLQIAQLFTCPQLDASSEAANKQTQRVVSSSNEVGNPAARNRLRCDGAVVRKRRFDIRSPEASSRGPGRDVDEGKPPHRQSVCRQADLGSVPGQETGRLYDVRARGGTEVARECATRRGCQVTVYR